MVMNSGTLGLSWRRSVCFVHSFLNLNVLGVVSLLRLTEHYVSEDNTEERPQPVGFARVVGSVRLLYRW